MQCCNVQHMCRTTRIFHHTPFDIVQRLSVVDGLVLKTVFQREENTKLQLINIHSIPQGDYIPNWLINSDFETVLAEYTRLRENGDDTELERYREGRRRYVDTHMKKEREELVRQIIDDYRRGETSNVHDASEQPRPPSQSPPADALAIDFASAYDLEDPSLSKLEEAFEQKKTLVRSVLGPQLSYTVWSARNQVIRLLNAPSLSVDPLELAVSLFVRRTYQDSTDPEGGAMPPLYRLTGWEAIASSLDLSLQPFQEGDRHPGAFETIFSPVGPIPAMRQIAFRTIRALLDVLGLDPCATLAKDMDDRDDRFVCLSCGGPDSGSGLPGKGGLPSSGRKRDRREAHNWREAVRSLRPRWRTGV
ncbi:hypothetical protein AAF712_013363 [Marasmius tenuissimus]|uniref:Uncharacterized protein n=1 Tax=Marasmius tenuissimus TaxID=585030 RepID=A0ABR2ZFZ9_9AGAR